MNRILMALALIGWCTCSAGAAINIPAEMAAIDRALIPVWAFTIEGRLDLAAKSMPLLQREWNGFKERHFAAKNADAEWRADFDRITALIGEADAILDGGRFPDLVRAPLERVVSILAALRQRNGIDYYPDYLVACRIPLDGIVSAAGAADPESVGRIRALYPSLRLAWQRVPAAGPGPEFRLTAAQRGGVPAMVEAESKALSALGAALGGNDVKAISAAAVALRVPFLRLYYIFGDFHAGIWEQPAAK